MLVLATPSEMQSWARQTRVEGATTALVPTMGALHAGHQRLIDTAFDLADQVVVSIFVNPLQFNQVTDFDSYPRPIDDDLAACAAAGITTVYAPTADTIYPPAFQTHVEPGDLADRLEGLHRPGHFRGVSTIVTKLFGAVQPDVALFGEKDYQQLAIIRRLVADLDLTVRIVGVPIVREPDGLALSSRNVRLTPADRAAAPVVSRALAAAAEAHSAGEHDAAQLLHAAHAVFATAPRARPEYVEVVDRESLLPVVSSACGAAIVTAVWFGEVRLIDNRVLEPRH